MSGAAPHSPACGSKGKKATSSSSNFAVSSISLFSISLLYPSISPTCTSINSDPESLWLLCLVSCSTIGDSLLTLTTHDCSVLISSPRSASIQGKALLDSASSSSFISEHLTQLLRLPRSKHSPQITGIGGIKALRHVSSNLLDPALIQSLPDSDNFTEVLSMNGVLVSIAAAYLCLNYLFQNFTKCTLVSTKAH